MVNELEELNPKQREKKKEKVRRKGHGKKRDFFVKQKVEKEKDLLLKANNKQNERIKHLEHQLQLVTKDKISMHTTLKLVKHQVAELVLRNEKINNELSNQQKQTAKVQPEGQWKLLCQIQAKFKSFRKQQSKKDKHIKSNIKNIESLKRMMPDMYRVMECKYEKQRVRIQKLEQQESGKQAEEEDEDEDEDRKRNVNGEKDVVIDFQNPITFSQMVMDIERELKQFHQTPLSAFKTRPPRFVQFVNNGKSES